MSNTVSQDTTPRISHSPYGTPVIPVTAMSENTRQFYEALRVRSASSSSASSASVPSSPPEATEEGGGSSWQRTPSVEATRTPPSPHSSHSTPTSSAVPSALPLIRPPPTAVLPVGPLDIVPRTDRGRGAPLVRGGSVNYTLHPELREAGLRWCPHDPVSRVPEPPRPRFHCTRLFLGQLPFELSSAQIRRLILVTAGVETLRLDPRSAGCFMAYYASDADAARVKALAGTILFDQEGAWVATTPAQLEVLQQYQQKIRGWTSFFLPRTALIVEDERKVSAE